MATTFTPVLLRLLRTISKSKLFKKISTSVQKAILFILSPTSQLFAQLVLIPDIPMKIPCSEYESRGS